MKYAKDEIQELNSFVGDKTYISTGYFDTMRGKEFQITIHSLKGKKYSLWEKLKLIWMFIAKI